jgi:hypothetical protein
LPPKVVAAREKLLSPNAINLVSHKNGPSPEGMVRIRGPYSVIPNSWILKFLLISRLIVPSKPFRFSSSQLLSTAIERSLEMGVRNLAEHNIVENAINRCRTIIGRGLRGQTPGAVH